MKQVFTASIINNDFEYEVLFETDNLKECKEWIEKQSKTINQPIILDWYYIGGK